MRSYTSVDVYDKAIITTDKYIVSSPIGKRIRNVREALELGRQEFVEKTGIPKGTIIGIEQGLREPKAGVLIAIAKAYPQYAAYLLTDEVGTKQKHPEVEELKRELPTAKRAS